MNPDKKVRRMQNLLYTSGVGTVLFSIWSGLRGIENLYEVWKELRMEQGTDMVNTVINIILCLFIFAVIMFFTFLYVYIGKTAIDVSCGKQKGKLYLVLSVLLNIFSWPLYIWEFVQGELFEVKTLVYIILDLTSTIILIEVIVFSLLLRKIR